MINSEGRSSLGCVWPGVGKFSGFALFLNLDMYASAVNVLVNTISRLPDLSKRNLSGTILSFN